MPTTETTEQPSDAERAMKRLLARLVAHMQGVNRTKSAMDGEVTDDLSIKHKAWRDAVEAWNRLPYELATEHRSLAAQIRSEDAARRDVQKEMQQ